MNIPLSELTFRTSRSGGPGGQNVNKVETRVEVLWHPESSTALTDAQKARIASVLAGRIDSEGYLHVISSTERSQLRNRERAVERLEALVAAALKPRAKRIPTRPSRAARERRIEEKKKRGETKARRRGEEG